MCEQTCEGCPAIAAVDSQVRILSSHAQGSMDVLRASDQAVAAAEVLDEVLAGVAVDRVLDPGSYAVAEADFIDTLDYLPKRAPNATQQARIRLADAESATAQVLDALEGARNKRDAVLVACSAGEPKQLSLGGVSLTTCQSKETMPIRQRRRLVLPRFSDILLAIEGRR